MLAALLGAAAATDAAVRAERRREVVARVQHDQPPAVAREARDRVELLAPVVGALAGWAVARLPGLLIGAVAAVAIVRVRNRRAHRVPPLVAQERFADAVGAMAASVRAGSSLAQAMRYAADESAEPARAGLQQLVADLDVGVPLDDAVRRWARREHTADADLVAGALDLHRRTGGDLPGVLEQVCATIRDRVAVQREVRSLTAQARLSAWILGLLPIGFFAFLWLTARRDIEGALSTPAGVTCLLVGLVLEALAVLWIRTLLVVA